MKKIAIIGCGASGTMLLANLVKKAKNEELDITVFHYGTPLARGIAYSTQIDGHLLNVVASDMGVWADNRNDFFEWLERVYPDKYNEKSFAPRKVFGQYLESILQDSKNLAKDKSIRLNFIQEEVTELPQGFDHICLTLGNKLKQFDNVEEINPKLARHIVIAGTGLSMIDIAVWLDEQNYRGKISLISLHGNLPYPYSLDTKVEVLNTVEIGDNLATVLDKYNTLVEKHGDWRSVIDSFRLTANQIWQAWTLDDKHEFLSKYNSEWSIRRHKIAKEIDKQVNDFFNKIELEKISARIDSVEKTTNGYIVNLVNGDKINCDAVVNCMGLNLNPKAHPIYADLLDKGLLNISEVGSGVIPSKQEDLHIMGSVLIGHLFESVAVPDLRGQAHDISNKILDY